MVKQISDPAAFKAIIDKPGLTIVDFTATWCGPCRSIAPIYEQLSEKYPAVEFIKVDVDEAPGIAGPQGVRAMPTFKAFRSGEQLDELKGANPQALEDMVVKHLGADGGAGASAAFGGQGHTMGAGSKVPMDPAAARLARFGAGAGGAAKAAAPAPAPTAMDTAQDDEELAKAIAMSMEVESPTIDDTVAPAEGKANAGTSPMKTPPDAKAAGTDAKEGGETKGSDEDGEDLVPLPVDATALAEIVSMGFPDVRARKGLHFGGGAVEAAITWITEHADDTNIDEEFLVRRCDVNKKPLTEEEMAAKMLALKELAAKRRRDRDEQEKKDAIKKEKERRERGQQLEVTQAERDRLQRQRENEKLRKEKADAKAEKERIMAEIARDKAVRAKNGGMLPTVLGVDGYNPSAIQYDEKTAVDGGDANSSEAGVKRAAPAKTTEEIIEGSIATISRYRTRGEGGNALKLLSLFVKNVAEKPTELKYRSISTESNAYKTKVAPYMGGTALLKALGFEKSEEGKLTLSVTDDDTTSFLPRFQAALAKLTAAEEKFRADNQT